MTFNRIAAAAKYPLPIRDIRLTLADVRLETVNETSSVKATVRVDPAGLELTRRGDLHVLSLDAVFACVDGSDRIVGDVSRTITLELTAQQYEAFVRDGLSLSVEVPVKEHPKRLKAVVYDYTTDRIGSTAVAVE